MKRALIAALALALVTSAPALAQEAPQGTLQLRLLAEPAGSEVSQLVFGEKASMVREGPKVRIWWLTVFAQPRDGPNGAKVQAVWNQMHLDCQAKTIQGREAVILDTALKVLFKGVGDEAVRQIAPNSLDSRTADFACSGKDPYPRSPAAASPADAVQRTRAAAEKAGRGPAPKTLPRP